MKPLFTIGTTLTGLLLFSTVVCGLWMRAQPSVDPSSVQFHMTIGLATAVMTVATLVVGAILVFRAG